MSKIYVIAYLGASLLALLSALGVGKAENSQGTWWYTFLMIAMIILFTLGMAGFMLLGWWSASSAFAQSRRHPIAQQNPFEQQLISLLENIIRAFYIGGPLFILFAIYGSFVMPFFCKTVYDDVSVSCLQAKSVKEQLVAMFDPSYLLSKQTLLSIAILIPLAWAMDRYLTMMTKVSTQTEAKVKAVRKKKA